MSDKSICSVVTTKVRNVPIKKKKSTYLFSNSGLEGFVSQVLLKDSNTYS